MNDNMLTVKAAVVGFFTTLGAFLGWKGILMFAWFGVMVLDYLSGTIAAALNGNWSSAVAREGIKHKGGMILVVAVSGIADIIMAIIVANVPVGIRWPGLIMPMVLAWYIITELGSILENAVAMGAPVPAWLVALLKSSANFVEAAGDLAAKDSDGQDLFTARNKCE